MRIKSKQILMVHPPIPARLAFTYASLLYLFRLQEPRTSLRDFTISLLIIVARHVLDVVILFVNRSRWYPYERLLSGYITGISWKIPYPFGGNIPPFLFIGY